MNNFLHCAKWQYGNKYIPKTLQRNKVTQCDKPRSIKYKIQKPKHGIKLLYLYALYIL